MNDNTIGHIIKKDLGLANFISKIYTITCLSLLGCILVSVFGPKLLLISHSNALLIGFIGSIISFTCVQNMEHNVIRKKCGHNARRDYFYTKITEDNYELVSHNSYTRIFMYILGIIFTGIMISPLVTYIIEVDPNIITYTVMLTSMTIFSASVYIRGKTEEDVSVAGPILVSMLSNMILISLSCFIIDMIFPANGFALSIMWSKIDTYFGILLFAAFIGYDTYLAIREYKIGNPDHLSISILIFLDSINIFIRIAKILLDNKKKK
jgi:FtsH-binding integral membrane protein